MAKINRMSFLHMENQERYDGNVTNVHKDNFPLFIIIMTSKIEILKCHV